MVMARTLPQMILQWTVLLLVLVPAMAQALSSDRRQPITIEADRATLNEKDGSSIYEGNVHLQQEPEVKSQQTQFHLNPDGTEARTNDKWRSTDLGIGKPVGGSSTTDV